MMVQIQSQHLLFYLAILLLQNIDNGATESILVASRKHFEGTTALVNISTCTNVPHTLVHKIKSVNTRDNCARLWSDFNCNGSSIDVLPYSPSHFDLNTFNDKTASVGPCRDTCNHLVTGQQPKDPFQITIYQIKDFGTSLKQHQLRVNGCTPVPKFLQQNFRSVQTSGFCLELWSNENCVPSSTPSKRPNYDRLEMRMGLSTYIQQDIGRYMSKVGAVSHCRYKCNERLESRKSESPLVIPTTEVYAASTELPVTTWVAETTSTQATAEFVTTTTTTEAATATPVLLPSEEIKSTNETSTSLKAATRDLVRRTGTAWILYLFLSERLQENSQL